MRRRARQERHGGGHEGGPGDAGNENRYMMREKLVSIGDDFWIQNAHGQKVYKVDGKAVRARDSYGVKIESGQDDIVILAVTVCIDQMAH